jgi:hypothetical protein
VIGLAARTRDALAVAGVLGEAGYPGPGSPDPHALDWLMQVHRRATDGPTRSAALREMSRQINPTRAVPFFLGLAVLNDRGGALTELIYLFRTPNIIASPDRDGLLAGLRRLWDEGQVKDALAAVLLRELAAEQRWPPPGGRSR